MIFLAFVVGLPILLLTIALVGGHVYRGNETALIDWQPTRSAETEIKLQDKELDQLLGAVNALRRRRGATARSVDRATGRLRG